MNTLENPIIVIALFSLVFVVLLPFYFYAEKQENFNRAMALKLTLSGLCALSALVGFVLWGMQIDVWRILIILSLICATFGDYYLQYIRLDEKKFNRGISWYAGTQFLLIVFLCVQFGIGWMEFVITAVLAAIALGVMFLQKWKLGSAQAPLCIYVLLLIFMACKAILAIFYGADIPVSLGLIAVGAGLFLLSDILLGVGTYKASSRALAVCYMLAYFFGIFLIATSVYF